LEVARRLSQLLGVLALDAAGRFQDSIGSSGTDAGALVHLHAYPGDSIEQLRAVLGVSQPGTVKVVDRLAAGGLLERRAGRDGRTRALHLTSAGRETVDRILLGRASALEQVLEVLDVDERARLEPLLEKLVSGLAHDRPGALTVCRMCDREVCCEAPAGCPLQHTVG